MMFFMGVISAFLLFLLALILLITGGIWKFLKTVFYITLILVVAAIVIKIIFPWAKESYSDYSRKQAAIQRIRRITPTPVPVTTVVAGKSYPFSLKKGEKVYFYCPEMLSLKVKIDAGRGLKVDIYNYDSGLSFACIRDTNISCTSPEGVQGEIKFVRKQ